VRAHELCADGETRSARHGRQPAAPPRACALVLRRGGGGAVGRLAGAGPQERALEAIEAAHKHHCARVRLAAQSGIHERESARDAGRGTHRTTESIGPLSSVPPATYTHAPLRPRGRAGAQSAHASSIRPRALSTPAMASAPPTPPASACHHETCPVSTEGWTRRVQFVREGGGTAECRRRCRAERVAADSASTRSTATRSGVCAARSSRAWFSHASAAPAASSSLRTSRKSLDSSSCARRRRVRRARACAGAARARARAACGGHRPASAQGTLRPRRRAALQVR